MTWSASLSAARPEDNVTKWSRLRQIGTGVAPSRRHRRLKVFHLVPTRRPRRSDTARSSLYARYRYHRSRNSAPDAGEVELAEVQVRLIAKGGRIGLWEITEAGESVFVPLERVRTHRNEDRRGTYRWYNDYRLPERLGSGIVTVRLHSNDEDKQRKFNRAENVRQIPPGDPDFETLYKRRNDAESINRHLDDTLWLRRAHSVGCRRQLLNLITYAVGVNVMSMHVYRQGLAPPIAA